MSLAGKLSKQILTHIKLGGSGRGATAAGTTNPIKTLIKDGNGDILMSTGTEVPSDTTSGYAKGALHIDTNVATGTTGLYCNKGTNTSCVFTAVTQA